LFQLFFEKSVRNQDEKGAAIFFGIFKTIFSFFSSAVKLVKQKIKMFCLEKETDGN
jgi:hypothetical protein